MSIKTQGTELYFIDKITVPGTPAVIKLDCPTGLSGVGAGAKDQIETTCLDVVDDKTFVSGLGTPGAITVNFNLDPTKVSHQILADIKASGDVIDWVVCFPDGTGDPTLVTDSLTPPAGRSSIKFSAFISDMSIDIATNTIVTGTLTLQRSGAVIWTYKS